MRCRGAYVSAMCGGNEDRATRVSSSANEEPLVIVETSIDVVRKVIGEDGSNSRDGVIGEWETSLCRSGRGSVRQRTSGVEDRDVGRGRSVGGRRGSEVFASGRSDEDVVRVDSDVLMERGKKEGVEDFLSDLGRSGRHRWWGSIRTGRLL